LTAISEAVIAVVDVAGVCGVADGIAGMVVGVAEEVSGAEGLEVGLWSRLRAIVPLSRSGRLPRWRR